MKVPENREVNGVSPAGGKNEQKPSKNGAPEGNENAIRHGLRGLTTSGRVPLKVKGGRDLRKRLGEMCLELGAEIRQRQGRDPSLFEIAVIQSAKRHEARAQLLERWLDKEWEKLSVQDRLAILREIGNATDSRDKCLKVIGLDLADRRSFGDGAHHIVMAGTAHHEPTFEERREFWTSLRQALLPVPEAYEAVNKLLADRVKENERRRNVELGQRDGGPTA
jgi:hypothetical protein